MGNIILGGRILETTMQKTLSGMMMAVVVALVCMFATNVRAESKAEKQEDIQKMAQQTLEQLYRAQPLAKAAIEKAAGYAVFSDMGFKILFGGSGNGQGVVVNNRTKQKTYIKMIERRPGPRLRNIEVPECVRVREPKALWIRSSTRAGSLAARRRRERRRLIAVAQWQERYPSTMTSGCTS